MSLRISGGRFAGRELVGPPARRRRPAPGERRAGSEARPTAVRLRKSLFEVISGEIEGARVLDGFAGAGTLGFEALSRGAAECVFVERSRQLRERIGRSALRLGLPGADLRAGPMERLLPALRRKGERFDLVFLDPPWEDWERRPGAARRLLAAAAALRPGLLVAVHRASQSLPAEIEVAVEAAPAPGEADEVGYRSVRTTSAGDGAFRLYRPAAATDGEGPPGAGPVRAEPDETAPVGTGKAEAGRPGDGTIRAETARTTVP